MIEDTYLIERTLIQRTGLLDHAGYSILALAPAHERRRRGLHQRDQVPALTHLVRTN